MQLTPFENVVQFFIEGLKISMDEIDTILLLGTRSATDSGRKPIFAEKLYK